MPISYLEPLSAGNAVRVYMEPPAGALYWRVLRRSADVFTGPDDDGAVVVADDCTDDTVLDLKALVNGTRYFYRMYSWHGAEWSVAPSASTVPAATYQGDAIDPLAIIADRLEAGLAVEVAREALIPQSGIVPVFRAPYALSDQVTFPCVTVHMDSTGPAERGLGEDPVGPMLGIGGWSEFQGWLARTQINVAGIARSSEERHTLRRALTRILQANLTVFAELGLNQIEFSFSDSEELTEKAAPFYLTGGSLTCIAHSFVAATVPVITDTSVTAIPQWSQP